MRPDGPVGGRRLVILRHGVTRHNAEGIWQGHLDSDLTPEGIAQAEAVAPVLAAYDPAIVVSSDLGRARVTAETVLAALPGRELRVDPRLREIHVGQWQGLEQHAMVERFPDAPTLLAGAEDFRRGEDGETYAEVGDRAVPAIVDVLADLGEDQTALVVTHGITASVLTGDLIGLDRRTSWLTFSVLGNCHWVELREFGAAWRLSGWNLRAGFGTAAAVR